MKRLNIKLAVSLLVGFLVVGLSVHFLHGFQVERNAGTLLEEAEEARAAGRNEEALEAIERYLKHRPKDTTAHVFRAEVAHAIAESEDASRRAISAAWTAMETAVRQDPENYDLRRKLLTYVFKINFYQGALEHAKLLDAAGKADGEVLMILATCYLRTGDFDRAAETAQRMIGYDPIVKEFDPQKAAAADQIDAYRMVAELLREKSGDEEQADRVIEQMVATNEKSVHAHLGRYHYWDRYHDAAKAKESLDKAFALDPESPDVILPRTEQALQEKNYDQAEQILQAGLQKHPKEEDIYRGLAIVAQQRGDKKAAKQHLKAGLEKVPESLVLLVSLLQTQVEEPDVAGARETLKTIKKLDFVPPVVLMYEGQLLAIEGKWKEAIPKLTEARTKLQHLPGAVSQVDMLLGACYGWLGESDLAMQAYRRVSNAQAGLTNADFGVATTLFKSGKNAEALKLFEAIAEAIEKGEQKEKILDRQFWAPLFELRVWDQIRRPQTERDWSKVDALVERLKQSDKLEETTKAILEARVLGHKQQLDEARALLSQAIEKAPNDAFLWANRVLLEEKESLPKALALATTASEEVRNTVTLRLMRASLITRIGGQNADENVTAALKALEAGSEAMKPAEQAQLLNGLAQNHLVRGDAANAKRVLNMAMERLPDDLNSRLVYFNVAIDDANIPEMEKILLDIRRISGANSDLAQQAEAAMKIGGVMGQVRKRVQTGEQKIDKIILTESEAAELKEARKILDNLVKSRPDWPEPHKLLAEVNTLENNLDGAIGSLQQAHKLGSLDRGRLRRLYDLLVAQQRFAEAQAIQNDLVGRGAAGLGRTQVEVAIRNKDYDEAKRLLASHKPKESDAVIDHLWYAESQRRANNLAEAETTLRYVVQAEPTIADGWLLLVNTLVSARKSNEARSVLDDAKNRLPEEGRDLLLAKCYEILQDRTLAEQHYVKAVKAAPNDLMVNQTIASFYIRDNKPQEALKYLDTIGREGGKAKEPAQQQIVDWARRARAVAIAADGSWEHFQEADALLRQSEAEASTSDLLLRVGLLAQRSEPSSMRTALKLLEELQTRQPLTAPEQATMAGLYERVGEWGKAKDLMLNILAQPDPDPSHYLLLVEMMLRNGEYGDAEAWLKRYDERQPDGKSIAMRATALIKQKRAKEGVALLLRALGPRPVPPARLPQLAMTATLLEQLDQRADAEKLYREFAKASPQGTLALARFVGLNGNLDEAISLFDEATKSNQPLDVFGAAIPVLRARKGEVQDKHMATLGKWYNAARQSQPNSPVVEMLLGDVRELRGELDKAEEVYRKVLARSDLPSSFRAMLNNNLAFILSSQNKNGDEAIKLVEEAMKVIGPGSDLLDTRGTVYLSMGKPAEAKADFEEAILQPTAMKYVHLAFAQYDLGEKEAAKASLAKAQELNLKRYEMYRPERVKYDQMIRELGM